MNYYAIAIYEKGKDEQEMDIEIMASSKKKAMEKIFSLFSNKKFNKKNLKFCYTGNKNIKRCSYRFN